MKFLDEIKNFFANKRHTEAIILAAIVVVILALVMGHAGGRETAASGDAASGTAVSDTDNGSSGGKQTSYKKEEKGSDLHDLLTEYYKDYAAGNTDDIEKIASPVSDMEKSYIRFMSGLLDSYDIKQIYTKDGADKNSKLVSVYVQMHFKDLKSAAPGLDFFYVQQDENGKLQINNLYSSFNQTNHENDMDPTVVSAIASFEEQKDVVDLQTKVQKEYNEISLSDKDFDEFMTKTYPDKVKAWQSDYRKDAKKAEKKAEKKEAEEKKKEEEEKTKEEEAQKKEDEKKSEEKTSDDTSDKNTYKTTTETNLRKKASIDSKIIKTLDKGTKVEKIETDGKWMKVKYKDKTGYIRKMYLKKVKSSSSDSSDSSDSSSSSKPKEGKKIVLKDTVNVRKKPSTDSKRINLAYAGDKVLVISNRDDGWTKIQYHSKKGYVKTEYLK